MYSHITAESLAQLLNFRTTIRNFTQVNPRVWCLRSAVVCVLFFWLVVHRIKVSLTEIINIFFIVISLEGERSIIHPCAVQTLPSKVVDLPFDSALLLESVRVFVRLAKVKPTRANQRATFAPASQHQ